MHFQGSDHVIHLAGIGNVHYTAAGHGSPVVLLHGLAASAVAWRYNIHALSQRYAVFAPDLPGHGDSAKPAVRYDTEFGLRFLDQFLDILRLDSPILVGNSTGGFLALAWALRHPGRAQALVLLDIPGMGKEVAWPLRLAALPGIGRLLDSMDVTTGGRFAPRLFRHPERMAPEVRKELFRLRKLPGASRAMLSALRSGISLMGLRSSLLLLHHDGTSLPVPTLVVWGQEDRIIPVEQARRFARRFPGVHLHVMPDCGHWPQMEQPDAFNDVVLAFLDKVAMVKDA